MLPIAPIFQSFLTPEFLLKSLSRSLFFDRYLLPSIFLRSVDLSPKISSSTAEVKIIFHTR